MTQRDPVKMALQARYNGRAAVDALAPPGTVQSPPSGLQSIVSAQSPSATAAAVEPPALPADEEPL